MSGTTVIYHRADFDGHFSAAVCSKFLPDDTQFIGWDYGDPLIDQPAGRTYIVDLSPDCLSSVRMAHPIIWIDHHKSAISKWDDQLGNPFAGYRVDGVAACRLCWQWFMNDYQKHGLGWTLPRLHEYTSRQVEEPLCLTLAGEYDVWNLLDPLAEPFQYGLTAGRYSWNNGLRSMLELPKEIDRSGKWVFPGDAETRVVAQSGVAAMEWQYAFAMQVCKERSYTIEWEGLTFCVLASCHTRNSTWFPYDAIPSECNALMAWRYDGHRVSFSLYHAQGHEQHDLSAIASKYGGGGHRGACGFSMTLDEAIKIIR